MGWGGLIGPRGERLVLSEKGVCFSSAGLPSDGRGLPRVAGEQRGGKQSERQLFAANGTRFRAGFFARESDYSLLRAETTSPDRATCAASRESCRKGTAQFLQLFERRDLK